MIDRHRQTRDVESRGTAVQLRENPVVYQRGSVDRTKPHALRYKVLDDADETGYSLSMNTRLRTRDLAIISALALGLLADQIVRTPGRPGLNIALWALAGIAVLWLLSHRRQTPVSRETRGLVAGALLFACLLMLRDTDALAVFCMFSAILLLGLAAGRGALDWARRAFVVDVAAAAVRVAALVALGPFGWSVGAAREDTINETGKSSWRGGARMLVRGALMALPVLIVLTALLTSADPVFSDILRNALFGGIQPLLQHLAFAGVIAWFTSGFLRAFMVSDEAIMQRLRMPRPALAPAEVAVAVSLLDLLFLAFMAVQVRYLFGGSGLVEVTKGLSYAEYARRGFFELVTAAALVVPVLLIANWAAADDEARSRRVLRATSTLLVVLLAGVLASAAYRMRLYQDAYGLTEQRVYVSVFMVWLTFVLAWLAFTVLRGRPRGFAFAAIVAGTVCVAALHVLNPHAMIARVNITRAASGARYDGKYLLTLSADAVPTLIDKLSMLPQAERCKVTTMLQKRWSGERPGGWKTWNLSDARARRLVSDLRTPSDCSVVARGTP